MVFFAWLIFTIVHLAFFASSFNIYQNIAIILVVVLVGLAILASIWVSWGLKFAGESKRKHPET